MKNYLSREFDFETQLEHVAGATIQKIVETVLEEMKKYGCLDALAIENHDGGLEFENGSLGAQNVRARIEEKFNALTEPEKLMCIAWIKENQPERFDHCGIDVVELAFSTITDFLADRYLDIQ